MQRQSRSFGILVCELIGALIVAGGVAHGAASLLSSSRSGEDATAFARDLARAMIRVHAAAAADGTSRRLVCNARRCRVLKAAPSGQWRTDESITVEHVNALIWAIRPSTEVAPTNPAGPLTSDASVTFYGNGSATAATVYVTDSARRCNNKIIVFGATGLSRRMSQW